MRRSRALLLRKEADLPEEGLRVEIKIIGGGLAGSEAAYQIAQMGETAVVYEMRPSCRTPAHKTGYLSELVCSNSLKSLELTEGCFEKIFSTNAERLLGMRQ